MGTAKGSFAELAIAKADNLVPKPASLTFEEAGGGSDLRHHGPPGHPRRGEGAAGADACW